MFAFDPLEPGAYDFAMFDPAWRWKNWSKKHNWRSPEAQYKTMALSQVARLPVPQLLKPAGVALVWCTWPMIAAQSMVIENAWGMEVKTGGAWMKRTRTGKLRVGTGHILRSVCEPFLICCKPGHKLKARGAAYNLVEMLRDFGADGLAREHSRKPEEVYELIESLTPGWRRADVYARVRRPGWEGFGKELGKFDKRRIITNSNKIVRLAA